MVTKFKMIKNLTMITFFKTIVKFKMIPNFKMITFLNLISKMISKMITFDDWAVEPTGFGPWIADLGNENRKWDTLRMFPLIGINYPYWKTTKDFERFCMNPNDSEWGWIDIENIWIYPNRRLLSRQSVHSRVIPRTQIPF